MKPLLSFLLLTASVTAQIVPGRYIIELEGDPAAVTVARKDSRFQAHRSVVRDRQRVARLAVANLGGTVLDQLDTVANALIVTVPEERAMGLANIPGILRIHPSREMNVNLDHALPLMKVPAAWAQLLQGQDSAGAGIKIGIIDSGIQASHPAFAGTLPALDGFPKVLQDSDRVFTNSKIIVAKNYTPLIGPGLSEPDADDHLGHGTGTSMIAGGGLVTGPYAPLSGVAPKAYLGNYKVIANGHGTVDDVIFKALDDAVADGMDVVNISLGGPILSLSQADPSDIASSAIERAIQAGVLVAIAAGNSGPGIGTVSSIAPSALVVGGISNDRIFATGITIDGAPPYLGFAGSGPAPRQAIVGPLFDIAKFDSTTLGCNPFPGGSLSGSVALIQRGTCNFSVKIANAEAAGAIGVIVYDNSLTFEALIMAVDTQTLPAMFTNHAEGLDLKSRLAATPGLVVTLNFVPSAVPVRPDLWKFASRGPGVGAAMKPDLVGVADSVTTASETGDSNGLYYDASGFQTAGGTSFSAPAVAGGAALLKGARPGLSGQQYRSLLINSADPVSADANTLASVQQAGAGLMDLAASLRGTIAAYPTSLNFGGGSSGTVNGTLDLTLWNLSGASDTFSVTAIPSGTSPAPSFSTGTVQVDPSGLQHVAVSMNVAGLAPGQYEGFVQVQGSQSAVIARIPYWFGVQGGDPAALSILYSIDSGSARQAVSRAIIFRITDVSGLPYTGGMQATVSTVSPGASVTSIPKIGDVPGTYAVNVRLGLANSVFTLTLGALTQTVTIGVL